MWYTSSDIEKIIPNFIAEVKKKLLFFTFFLFIFAVDDLISK